PAASGTLRSARRQTGRPIPRAVSRDFAKHRRKQGVEHAHPTLPYALRYSQAALTGGLPHRDPRCAVYLSASHTFLATTRVARCFDDGPFTDRAMMLIRQPICSRVPVDAIHDKVADRLADVLLARQILREKPLLE